MPIILLSVCIFIFGMYFIYNMYSNATRDELKTCTSVLKGCLNLTVQGDYTYDDALVKGNVNISDSSMLYEVKKNSNIDTTIFWGDTRIMTTIEGQYGILMAGTKADAQITEKVLEQGKGYYADSIEIGGKKYIGYYTPLNNEDGSIVGMIFAGKPKLTFYRNIGMLMLIFFLLTLSVVLIVSAIWRKFSGSLISDVELIKSYLHNIAEGDLAVTMDERIVHRNDEIGEIGMYAAKMCEALAIMVERDPLTLLYNRRTCNQKIQKLVEEQKPFTIVMGDIDLFKMVNDHYGHACGDEVLKSISSILKANVQDCGFASRWGGEEFLLIYEMDLEHTKSMVEAFVKQVRNHVLAYEDREVRVTMTVGVKEMDYAFSYEKMIKCADDNLYEGKRNGRNRIVYE